MKRSIADKDKSIKGSYNELTKLRSEISELRSFTNKSNKEKDNYLKELKVIKDEKDKLLKENESLNQELDEYENESKAMDKEIKIQINEIKILKKKNEELENENERLKIKIEELNIKIKSYIFEIERLKARLLELESSDKSKDKNIPKEKNALFCYLYNSFSKKILIKYKLEMLIGMYMRQVEKEMGIKMSKLNELNNIYQKRIKILNEENESLKKRLQGEKEKETLEQTDDGSGNRKFSRFRRLEESRSYSQGGLTQQVNTSTRHIGNTIITTKTTQISYKKKRRDENI